MVQLIRLLGNKNIIKIIEFFLRCPTIEISQIKLLKSINIAKATLIKWLNPLISEKILLMKRVGVTNLYKLNNKSILVKHIKVLFSIYELKQVEGLATKYGCNIYIYGSSARGENVESSDIDLLIIGTPDKGDIIKELNQISKKIKKDIKPQIFSKQEWSLMARNDPAFYERVEKDKVELV